LAQPSPTFIDEAFNALRGTVALVVGNRQASSYFDFRNAGLIGSFIAVLVGMAVQAFAPPLLSPGIPSGAAAGAIMLGFVMLGVQFLVAYLVLRLLGRADGFIPFVVVQNWVTLFQSLLAVASIAIFGQPIAISAENQLAEMTPGTIPFLLLGIAAMVVWINMARLILTLKPMHVAMFVFIQLGAAFLLQPIILSLA
jgi:hypothetical protein